MKSLYETNINGAIALSEQEPDYWKVISENVEKFTGFLRDTRSLFLFDAEDEAGFGLTEHRNVSIHSDSSVSISSFYKPANIKFKIAGPENSLKKLIPMLKRRKYQLVKTEKETLIYLYTGREDSKQH